MGRKRSLTVALTPKLVDEEEDSSSESGSEPDDDNMDHIASEGMLSNISN